MRIFVVVSQYLSPYHHWESTFGVPRGREREFAELVGGGVYEDGFAGLRAYLGTPSNK